MIKTSSRRVKRKVSSTLVSPLVMKGLCYLYTVKQNANSTVAITFDQTQKMAKFTVLTNESLIYLSTTPHKTNRTFDKGHSGTEMYLPISTDSVNQYAQCAVNNHFRNWKKIYLLHR